ncbi:hypothetical protein BZG02_14460 [Labilibaculum filiforme]|uniref:beta-glucosidase n=1 Tax=Labilibaculum filiforme TaxID=1940526 RepID=A0A2N3HUS9_9BACT|nr:glycoside hydrolase family 3 N-terminal domain-containing protein [Labilibaculum filiforme]PKQ61826.1 hypothetical protein BZG02_14460 [Labilibaculum filiforme]
MKSIKFLIVFIVIIGLASCSQTKKESQQISESEKQIAKKIDGLLSQMSYAEKMGQLSQVVLKKSDDNLEQQIRAGKVGSLLLSAGSIPSVAKRNEMQRIAVEESRLGIPIIFGHDVIHGYKTIFPLSLAQSCTWDTLLVKEAASLAAKEASAFGIDWTFAPMVDVSRDPRWGRIAECFGEDAYLNGCFGAASIKGYQGEDVANPEKVVACLKHFVGYGAAMGGRDYQYTEISERSLHEVYLPPFKAGVDAGALTVMSAFNDINGIPSTANEKNLTQILKNKWQFPGFVVSDWDAVEHLTHHGMAADSIDAGVKALHAGIDMEMKSLIYPKIPKGKIDGEKLDEAVRRVLYVKFRKALFANPYTDEKRQDSELLSKEKRALARKVAAQSMVLLENNQVLPIRKGKLVVSVVGPFAKEKQLMGWWRSEGNEKDLVSASKGLKDNAPAGVQVIDEVNASTDVIIACVGEKRNLFGENNSRSDIRLPNNQSEFIEGLKKHKKPIVTVVFNGRPLNLAAEKQNSDALLIAWHPGTEAGNALADLIYGNENPSGKLTTTFPAATGHIPMYYNHRNSGRPELNTYLHQLVKPLYPFGYGLTYSVFKYEDIQLSSSKMNTKGSFELSAKITNTSKTEGTEIVQLYIHDLVGSTTRPIKELKGFKKISLKAGEAKEVKFIVKAKDLAVLNADLEPVVEAGEFEVWIAPNSDKGLKASFTIEASKN